MRPGEVALVADDNEVGAYLHGISRDQFGSVAGPQPYVEVNPSVTGTLGCVRAQSAKEAVLFALDLVDLAKRRGVGGKRTFDGERRQLRAQLTISRPSLAHAGTRAAPRSRGVTSRRCGQSIFV